MVCLDRITNLGLTPSSQPLPVHWNFPHTDCNTIPVLIFPAPFTYLACMSWFQPHPHQKTCPKLIWEDTESYYSQYPVTATTSVPSSESVQCTCSLMNSQSVNGLTTHSLRAFSSCSEELPAHQPSLPVSLWAPPETMLDVFKALCHIQVGTQQYFLNE